MWFSLFSAHQNHLKGLLKHRLLDFTPQIPDSVEKGQGPNGGISNKAGISHFCC